MQYLCNISNNKFGIEVIFDMQKIVKSFYKLVLSFLMEVARHIQNPQNRAFLVFLQYVQKHFCNYSMFSCDAKHSGILRDSSHVFVSCLCLKLQLSLIIKDWFVNFVKIVKKNYAKLSEWIANHVLWNVNLNPERLYI